MGDRINSAGGPRRQPFPDLSNVTQARTLRKGQQADQTRESQRREIRTTRPPLPRRNVSSAAGWLTPIRDVASPPPTSTSQKIDPFGSLYTGAYDSERLGDEQLEKVFGRGAPDLDARVDRLEIRPDDIARARELGLVDDVTAQRLANKSLDALEQAGAKRLPKEIRYTHAGPFYFQVDKDDEGTLRELKTAMGLDPDRRAHQKSNPEDNTWDFETLERMRDEGRLQVVDRFGQSVDIFSTTEIDGRQERLVNPKVEYRSIDYERHDEHGDEKRKNALNGDKVMIEAWNHDLSKPDPGVVYEVPSYESPDFNEGQKVDIHSDDTKLWRFETSPDPDKNGQGRVGRVTGEINVVKRARDQIEERLTDELGETPDEATLNAAVKAHERKRGWAKHQGMQYIRYGKDQTPAGNEAMVDAGMRDPDQDVPYSKSKNRYNGGHVLAASLGGIGEGINVSAQAEGNNQDRFAQVKVNRTEDGVTVVNMSESWHDWERHLKNLSRLENTGLTTTELEAQGFTVPDAIKEKYGPDTPVRFEVQTSIRSWYEDDGTDNEAPETRHTREFARFTGTRLVDKETGDVVGEMMMANYNVGSSDEDYAEKIQMLFDAGLLDEYGGYDDDADMSAIAGGDERPPDVRGGGTLSDILPSEAKLRAFTSTPEFRELWGPNVQE